MNTGKPNYVKVNPKTGQKTVLTKAGKTLVVKPPKTYSKPPKSLYNRYV